MDSAAGCAICLKSIKSEAFPDVCFHRFCFHCILKWAEVEYSKKRVRACPLCRTNFSSIIHGFNGTTFQRHSFVRKPAAYTSETHSRRLAAYGKEPDCSKEIVVTSGYANNEKWLRFWTQRELQALMQDDDTDVVVHHVIGTLESMRKHLSAGRRRMPSLTQLAREKLLDLDTLAVAVKPFVFDQAEQFCREVSRFLASGLTIAAYDNALENAEEEVETELEVRAREALFDAEDEH